MTGSNEPDLTHDGFLGGALTLCQPRGGYRAGLDPVLLAASVPALSGQTVLELGCGAGAAILCLGRRVPGLSLTGVELQDFYAGLARQNAKQNALDLDVVQADLTQLPDRLRQMQFDHVIANPPYYRSGAHTGASDPGRRTALGGDTALDDWIKVAAKRLTPRGYLHMIQRVDRLPDMLMACDQRLGSVEMLPLSARAGQPPNLVILRARKGGRADFRLHAPLIFRSGAAHADENDGYRPEISDILRNGAALNWPR